MIQQALSSLCFTQKQIQWYTQQMILQLFLGQSGRDKPFQFV